MTIRDPDDCASIFDLAEEARRLFDEADDGPGRAASRDFLASIHEHIGDLAGGLELALDALSIAREIGDPIRQGYALSNVGGILAASGEVEPAVERLKEALQLFEGAQDLRPGSEAICSRLAKVLKNAGRSEEALTYAEMCRDAAEQDQDEFLALRRPDGDGRARGRRRPLGRGRASSTAPRSAPCGTPISKKSVRAPRRRSPWAGC